MGKQRFSSLDVTAISSSHQKLVGSRLQNIYDLNQKTFLFKFNQNTEKINVLVEAGTRMHSTIFTRQKLAQPSAFCTKLRKVLRTRRLDAVVQLGTDRIIQLTFGTLDNAYHLFFEFYAKGNILLTDHDFVILSVQRLVENFLPGQIYNMQNYRRSAPLITSEKITEVMNGNAIAFKGNLKKGVKNLFSPDYGSAIMDHCLCHYKLPDIKFKEFTPDMIPVLFSILQEAEQLLKKFITEPNKKSFVFFATDDSGNELYTDFQPYLFEQYAVQRYHEYDNLDLAVDEYFSKLESQKHIVALASAQLAADRKLDAVRSGHANQVSNFDVVKELRERQAEAIQAHLGNVEMLILTLRGLISQGMDWVDLKDLIKEEQRSGNDIAKLVVDLKLDIGMATIKLSTGAFDEEFDEEGPDALVDAEDITDQDGEFIQVDIDIYSSAYANASRLYQDKKVAVVKQAKTIQAASRAVDNIEKKILANLAKTTANVENVTQITKARRPYWWEKYIWFISSENFLVIGGRDASQNETLVKSYLKKGDIYVHADLHGAASVIIKNVPHSDLQIQPPPTPAGTCPIPPQTLLQAATLSICQSRAWDAKIVTSAWWVYHDQVSKTAPTGEYLTTGSFMVRGKKNWLPPVQLIYGFGMLFRVDQECIFRHLWERRPWARGEVLKHRSADSNDEKLIANLEVEENTESDLDASLDGSDRDFKEPVQALADELGLQDLQLSRGSSGIIVEESAGAKESKESDEEFDVDNQQFTESAKYKLDEISASDTETAIIEPAQPVLKSRQQSNRSQQQLQQQQNPSKPKAVDGTISSIPTKVRGKRGKEKKIKEKYAEQDSKDREMAIEFLASDKGPQPKGKKAKAAAAAKREFEDKLAKRAAAKLDLALLPLENTEEPIGDDKVEDVSETIRTMLKEENIEMVDADVANLLTNMDELTGQPHHDDILTYAIPVCAPWSTLQKYSYKVKLLPGSLKKGKAGKSAINAFLNMGDGGDLDLRCRALIKSVPEPEIMAQILGRTKVVTGNTTIKVKKNGRN